MERIPLATRLNGVHVAAGEKPRRGHYGGELVDAQSMSNLNRRLRKLEAVMTDEMGLVPGSPQWWVYWFEQLYRYIDREPGSQNTKVPFEVVRAYTRAADPDGARWPPAMLRKRCIELSLDYQRKHNRSCAARQ